MSWIRANHFRLERPPPTAHSPESAYQWGITKSGKGLSLGNVIGNPYARLDEWVVSYDFHTVAKYIKDGQQWNLHHTSLSPVFRRTTEPLKTSKNEIRKLRLDICFLSSTVSFWFTLAPVFSILSLWCCALPNRSSLSLSWLLLLPHHKEIRSPLRLFHQTAKWTLMAATHLRKLSTQQLLVIHFLNFELHLTVTKVRMAPRSPRAEARNKLDLNPKISVQFPADLTRSPIPMASFWPSTGLPMKAVSRALVTICQLLRRCPSTSSRCSLIWKLHTSYKLIYNNLLIGSKTRGLKYYLKMCTNFMLMPGYDSKKNT